MTEVKEMFYTETRTDTGSVGPPTGGSKEGPVHRAMHRLDKTIEAANKIVGSLRQDLVPVLNGEMELAGCDKPLLEASGSSPIAMGIDSLSHRLSLICDLIGEIKARLEV